MTAAEFEGRYLSATLRKPERQETQAKARPRLTSASAVPEYVNWYEQGKVSESVDQGGCGACWAFTSASVLESLDAIENDLAQVPKFSV